MMETVKGLLLAMWISLSGVDTTHSPSVAQFNNQNVPLPVFKPGSSAPSGFCKPCDVSDTGVALIRLFEGYSPYVYEDAAGYPTIGFGHLIKAGESFSEPLLPEAAEKLLRKDVRAHEVGVNRDVVIVLRQWQYDALVSFAFNLGNGALQKSTLLKRVNAERHPEVPEQFMRWVNAGGKKLRGLVRRRKAEATMYEGD